MRVQPTKIPEVALIEPRVFIDSRGHFLETYKYENYCKSGISVKFVQDNISFSYRNVLRGLHYQLGQPQGKLVMVMQGEILDIAVDIRKGSPSFGQSVSVILSSENYKQLFIPEGFAHGFCVISETATVFYKCTDYYAPAEEHGIIWNDPAFGLNWPTSTPILSEKDRNYPTLSNLNADELPSFKKINNCWSIEDLKC